MFAILTDACLETTCRAWTRKHGTLHFYQAFSPSCCNVSFEPILHCAFCFSRSFSLLFSTFVLLFMNFCFYVTSREEKKNTYIYTHSSDLFFQRETRKGERNNSEFSRFTLFFTRRSGRNCVEPERSDC